MTDTQQSTNHVPRMGGIVLCGGLSTRMGRPKAWLPFGDETCLQRVVRTLQQVVSPVVVVAAVEQELPSLPADIVIARDQREALGPVGGMAAGFAALQGKVDAVYVSACDVPLLKPEVVRFMCQQLGEHDIAIPVEPLYSHPLSAVYRLSLAPKLDSLIAANRLRVIFLWDGADVRRIPVDAIRPIDPQLGSYRNANTPEEYAALCAVAKLENRL